MIFCCERFGNYYSENGSLSDDIVQIERFPNIKIIKLPSDMVSNKKPYRYLFVCGLDGRNPPFINMAFCPFCGSNLFITYDDDKYINGLSEKYF